MQVDAAPNVVGGLAVKLNDGGSFSAIADTRCRYQCYYPCGYRDPKGHWFGLTRRGRVVYASNDRVSEAEISYTDLANPKWKRKICIRSGQHDYNLALFSALIAHWGEEKTEEWLEGFKGKPGVNEDLDRRIIGRKMDHRGVLGNDEATKAPGLSSSHNE